MSTHPRPAASRRGRIVAAFFVSLAALAAAVGGASPASAAARVSVAGPDGTATFAANHATEVTVTGSGFQSIPRGFGGIYVLFGWVDDAASGSWRPSQGGEVGSDYRYVPDAESADNAGFQRFIAFPGGQTESAANGVLAADGSWSISMRVPGATFESQNREGDVVAVDCREVTCGIITIGAHGVKNGNNETFTPVSFATAAPSAPTAPAAGGGADDGVPEAPAGSIRVGVESATVDAGTAIVFTGQGFTPGEQVVASLDSGLAAVGPLTAGARGEVAGAMPVPADAKAGTHLLTLRGAASDSLAETEITVTGGPALASVGSTTPQTPAWVVVVLLAAVVLALVLVVTSIVTEIVRARRRRAARRGSEAAHEKEMRQPLAAPLPAASVPAPPVPATTGVGR